jgi:phosphoribosylamine--glycine ligase
LVQVMLATIEGKLDQIALEWDPRSAVCVVLASDGYGWKPDDQVKKGVEITGLEAAAQTPDTVIFHGGTALKDGKLVTSGGRVLGITSLGTTLADARARAESAIAMIHFEGMQWRKDIGAKTGK